MVHIPYKSGGQALTAVVSGEADVLFQTIPPTLPFVESRRLKPIAVCTLERHPLFPKLPTANESGLPGFDISTWYGILAPAATPKAIVDKLGVDPVTNTPGQFNALVRSDLAKWAKVAKAANIKVN
jgi:tripartite-type tricarboxylate transporter receptor subunit TctC